VLGLNQLSVYLLIIRAILEAAARARGQHRKMRVAFLFLSTLARAHAQVIIKQYIEGNGFDKAIQLENIGAGATVWAPVGLRCCSLVV
jgi:hypothetical protein